MRDATHFSSDVIVLGGCLCSALIENDYPAIADRLFVYDNLALLYYQDSFVGFLSLDALAKMFTAGSGAN